MWTKKVLTMEIKLSKKKSNSVRGVWGAVKSVGLMDCRSSWSWRNVRVGLIEGIMDGKD